MDHQPVVPSPPNPGERLPTPEEIAALFDRMEKGAEILEEDERTRKPLPNRRDRRAAQRVARKARPVR